MIDVDTKWSNLIEATSQFNWDDEGGDAILPEMFAKPRLARDAAADSIAGLPEPSLSCSPSCIHLMWNQKGGFPLVRVYASWSVPDMTLKSYAYQYDHSPAGRYIDLGDTLDGLLGGLRKFFGN